MPLVLLLIAIFAAGLPTAARAQSLEQGYELLDARAFPEAIAVFQQAVAINPDDAKAHEGLAWAYYETREYALAATEADTRLALAPTDTEWHRSWAIIVWETPERQAEVLATVQRWAEQDPGDAAAQRLYGKVLADSGDYTRGRQVLSAVLVTDPNDIEALLTLARIEQWDQQFDAARDLLARALALRPDDETIQHDLAVMTREAQGRRLSHFEPTLPMALVLIFLSVLGGQLVRRLTPAVHIATFGGVAALVAVSLVWLYAAPLG